MDVMPTAPAVLREPPHHIQRRRTAGWRMPAGAIAVTRPGKWGNPYVHVQTFYGLDRALALFAETAQGGWNPGLVADWPDAYVALVYDTHCAWVKRIGGNPVDAMRRELRGHDLACWCKTPAPGEMDRCHAAILLALANDWTLPAWAG